MLEQTNDTIHEMPTLDPITGALVTAGTAVVGSIVGNKLSLRNQRLAYEQQKALIADERRYNDPSQQMIRLERAGINPHMAYMKGSLNNVVSSSGKQVQQARTIDINPPMGEALKLSAIINNLKADTEQKQANTENIQERTTQQKIENFVNGFLVDFGNNKLIFDDGKVMRSGEAFRLYLEGNTKYEPPPRVKAEFEKLITQIASREGIKINNDIRELEKTLKQMGITYSDDLAVRAGVLVAKAEGVDVGTTQGALIAYDIIQSILGLAPRFRSRSPQRGITERTRSVYNREGTYMGGQKETVKY